LLQVMRRGENDGVRGGEGLAKGPNSTLVQKGPLQRWKEPQGEEVADHQEIPLLPETRSVKPTRGVTKGSEERQPTGGEEETREGGGGGGGEA